MQLRFNKLFSFGLITTVLLVSGFAFVAHAQAVTSDMCLAEGGQIGFAGDAGGAQEICRGGTHDGAIISFSNQTTVSSNDSSDDSPPSCSVWRFSAKTCVETIAITVVNMVLMVAAFFLWVAGLLLNISIEIAVVHFGTFVDGGSLNLFGSSKEIVGLAGVRLAWTILRDLANIGFIFAFLYVAIATILQDDFLPGWSTQKLISKAILAALLINFSYFCTSVIIDSSNILAKEFYGAILNLRPATTITGAPGDGQQALNAVEKAGGLSGVFSGAMRISRVYHQAEGEVINPLELITRMVMGIIFILTTAFIFFAAAFLFIARFVRLLYYLITSPLAFVASVFPGLQEFGKKWWSGLLSQAFFAPVYLLLLFVVARIVTHDSFKAIQNFADITTSGSVQATNIAGGALNSILTIFNFAIVIGLLVAALVSASKLGAEGSKTLLSWGKTLRTSAQGAVGGWVGRQTIGRASQFAGKAYDQSVGRARDRLNATLATRIKEGKAGRVEKFVGTRANLAERALRERIGKGEEAKFGGKLSLRQTQQRDQKALDVATKTGSTAEAIREGFDAVRAAMTLNEEGKVPRDVNNNIIATGNLTTAADSVIQKFFEKIGKMSNEQLEELARNNVATLKDARFAAGLTPKQIEKLDKLSESGAISSVDFDKIKDARKNGLLGRVAHADNPQEEAVRIVGSMPPKEVAKLGKDFLTHEHVAENLHVNILKEIMNESTLDNGAQSKIRESIRLKATGPTSTKRQEQAWTWLNTKAGSGGAFFGT